MTIAVRPARPDDSPVLAEIVASAWRHGFRGVVPPELTPDRAEMEERLDARIREPAGPVAVAEIDGQVGGYVVFGPTHDADAPPRSAEVYALYVHPSVWRRGLGRALVEFVLERSRERGFGTVALWTFADTPRSRSFYEALGFSRDGARQRRPMSGGALEIRYRRKLRA